jgi:hypothetical protein
MEVAAVGQFQHNKQHILLVLVVQEEAVLHQPHLQPMEQAERLILEAAEEQLLGMLAYLLAIVEAVDQEL